MRGAALLATLAAAAADDVGFTDWFTTELKEVIDQELVFSGEVPSWLNGTLVQGGPGRMEIGGMSFGHALDGFTKLNRFVFSGAPDAVKVTYSATFLMSGFYRESLATNTIAPGMLASETIPPSRAAMGAKAAAGPNDNNYIKAHLVGGTELMCSDTPTVHTMEGTWMNITSTLEPAMPNIPGQQPDPYKINPVDWTGAIIPGLGGKDHLCQMGSFAHGWVDPQSGEYIVGVACNALVPSLYRDYHVVFKVAPGDLSQRTVVAAIKLPKGRLASYQHHNALTEGHYCIIGVPLFLQVSAAMKGKTFSDGGLITPIDVPTVFQCIDRKDPSQPVREWSVEGMQMGHVINAYDDGDDIVVDITYYTQESGGFFPRYTYANLNNKTARDAFSKGTAKRYILKANGTAEQSLLFPSDGDWSDVELPTLHPDKMGKKYCIYYIAQFSHVGGTPRPFASMALLKRNLCTGEKTDVYREGIYPSEHRFIPRPGATEEDDGVLVGVYFDGSTKLSSFEIVDAKTAKVIAEAPLGIKVPFPIHTTWFQDNVHDTN